MRITLEFHWTTQEIKNWHSSVTYTLRCTRLDFELGRVIVFDDPGPRIVAMLASINGRCISKDFTTLDEAKEWLEETTIQEYGVRVADI